jgi:hypothetical protein
MDGKQMLPSVSGVTSLKVGGGKSGDQPALLQSVPPNPLDAGTDFFPHHPDQTDMSAKWQIDNADGGATQQLGETVLAAAHDLFEPLTAVMLYLIGCRRLLDLHDQDQASLMRDALDRAQSQVLRAANIAKQLCRVPVD